ncbi:MAG: hypothetical protein AB1830_13215 [Pseudomonadota bacterium]
MASNIDPNKPTSGNAKTADVRANFAAAKAEIEALQAGKQDLDALLSAIAALNTATDKLMYFIGADQVALADLTPAARSVLALAGAANKLAYYTGANDAALTDLTAAARALLALAGAADRLPYFTGASTAALATLTAFARSLLDDQDANAAQQTLTFPAPTANTFLRRNAGNTVYEAKTPQQVADELVGLRDWRGRNALINGNFDIWQRGFSLASGTGNRYLADRWRNDAADATISASRQGFILGQTDVPGEPTFFHRCVVTAGTLTNSLAILTQNVEDVRTFAGQTITLSFWARADASKNIAIEFVQFFGSGGTPSPEVNAIGVTTIALTTLWQKFLVTVSIPSISGKTLGTNKDSYLSVKFWFEGGSNFNTRTNSLGHQSGTFDIAQVQLELGSVATPFERRHMALELELAQRYYEKSFKLDVAPVQAVGDSANASFFTQAVGLGGFQRGMGVVFKVRKRAAPTITTFNPINADNQLFNINAGVNWSGTSVFNQNETGFELVGTSSSAAGGPGNGAVICWTADAEL